MKAWPLFFSGIFCLFCSTANANKPVSATQSGNIICQKQQSPEEMVFVLPCEYKNMGVLQAYELYISRLGPEEKKDFIKHPSPGQDKRINDLGNAQSVEYKWQGVNDLRIDQFYDGGETTLSFKYNGKDTTVITTLYPD